jgi:hypothetical protein
MESMGKNIMGDGYTGVVEQRNIDGLVGDAVQKFNKSNTPPGDVLKYEISTNRPKNNYYVKFQKDNIYSTYFN